MDMYGGHHDYSLYLFDMSSTDPTFMESLYNPRSKTLFDGDYDDIALNKAAAADSIPPPKHRRDGSSPLPFGMDWSPPPRIWDGQNSVWPHDSHSWWSYCVTVPSWTIIPKARGSDPVVFYRVQVGIQSPEGITSIRGILKRYSDFLKLSSDLKREFPKKKLPPTPPKGILRLKRKELMEERRCSLEDWMEKLLSDIDMSRSLPVATFLELEAAARSAFHESYQNAGDASISTGSVVPSGQILSHSDSSLVAGTSFGSDYGNDSTYVTSELGTPRHGRDIHTEFGMNKDKYDGEITNQTRSTGKDSSFTNSVATPSNDFVRGFEEKRYSDEVMDCPGIESLKIGKNARKISQDSFESGMSSARLELPESVEALNHTHLSDISNLELSHNLSIVLPTEEKQKMNRVLTIMQQRLATATTDIEDLIARLNQELAVRQYLSTKVKDLEIELESTNRSKEESLQQAVLSERESVTQMQWDMAELRRNCMEMELKLKYEQEQKVLLESEKTFAIQENESLLQKLEIVREQAGNLLKLQEESELKSKSDVKILAKEIKALRISQSELKKEISRLTNEKVEAEKNLQKERQRRECTSAANAKLLHECEILCSRLEECSVNFLIEEETKLTMNTSSPSEAIDILSTSDNRIGLLLAEVKLGTVATLECHGFQL